MYSIVPGLSCSMHTLSGGIWDLINPGRGGGKLFLHELLREFPTTELQPGQCKAKELSLVTCL